VVGSYLGKNITCKLVILVSSWWFNANHFYSLFLLIEPQRGQVLRCCMVGGKLEGICGRIQNRDLRCLSLWVNWSWEKEFVFNVSMLGNYALWYMLLVLIGCVICWTFLCFFLLSRICNLALCSLVWFLWCGLWKLRIFRPWYALYDIVFGVLRYECLYFDLYVCPNVCLNHYTNEEFLQYNTQ
jgi:hypothetical protein